MRKIDPEGVWSDFADQLAEQARFYNSSWGALTAVQDRKIATENYALTLGVLFEGFANDLIFAYANRDCSRVMQHLETSVREALQSNQKAAAAFDSFAEFKSQRHLTKDELKTVLDPSGRNTSFPTYAAIEGRAKQWLIAAHVERFTRLIAQQKAIIDLTIAFRNNLAHRSKSSLDRLNDVLALGALHPTGLRRGVNRVQQAGHYLKSQMNGGTRATVLAGLLRAAAYEIVR
ncbi:hypothetical protein [Rhodovulum sp. MB263]|uniref:hypothetical protein n=1 Tax=Rhodovulum sp. (strain MB263) TaxID=308754 RepID=UPI0009B75AA4|nr:hypothetical protein [Rhodovulum sp. MB263]ARC87390.1 hypothetical protein B5V46_01470 [Rhodovulum sp. MB263]